MHRPRRRSSPTKRGAGFRRGVRDLVFLLLEKDPKDRPENAAEVVRRLHPLRLEESTTRRPRTAADTDSRPPSDTAKDRQRTTGAPRTDTVALLEQNRASRGLRAALGRDVPTGIALTLVLGLSLATFGTTYLVRWHTANTQAAAAPSEG